MIDIFFLLITSLLDVRLTLWGQITCLLLLDVNWLLHNQQYLAIRQASVRTFLNSDLFVFRRFMQNCCWKWTTSCARNNQHAMWTHRSYITRLERYWKNCLLTFKKPFPSLFFWSFPLIFNFFFTNSDVCHSACSGSVALWRITLATRKSSLGCEQMALCFERDKLYPDSRVRVTRPGLFKEHFAGKSNVKFD